MHPTSAIINLLLTIGDVKICPSCGMCDKSDIFLSDKKCHDSVFIDNTEQLKVSSTCIFKS